MTLTRRFLLAVASFSFFGLGAGCSDRPADSKEQANFEVEFLTGMIDHHSAAVAMAKMGVERASRKELREMSGQIVTAQAAEIGQLAGWLRDWYGKSHSPAMDDMSNSPMKRLHAAAPAEFDREFTKAMIEHHSSALSSGRRCEEKASHAELKKFCRGMVEMQQREIDLMKGWQ